MSEQNSTLYDFVELPADPEEAFLILEDRFRCECEIAVRESGEHDNVSVYYTPHVLPGILGVIC